MFLKSGQVRCRGILSNSKHPPPPRPPNDKLKNHLGKNQKFLKSRVFQMKIKMTKLLSVKKFFFEDGGVKEGGDGR